MDKKEFALMQHEKWNGKIEVISRAKIETPEELAVAYTPGVAQPCIKISENKDLSYKYTRRGNMVAVVTDGTAVLGLGDIGPEAGMPVMEGKCALFKTFADVDAFPLCIRSKEVDDIVKTVSLLAGSFGGVNLEDISAPRCFEIERKLKECCDIPIFHDDQHGTAVVTAAALINGLKVVGKKLDEIKVVTSGAGAAGAGHHTRHHGRQHQARRYHVLPSAVHRGHTAEGIRRAGAGAGRGLRELWLHRSVCHSGDGPLLPPCTDCKALPAPRRGGVRALGQGAV